MGSTQGDGGAGGRDRRFPVPLALLIGVAVVAAVAIALAAQNLLRGPADAERALPAAYYAIDDRGDSHLIRQPLDGRTPASTIAVKRLSLAGGGSWAVSPDGTVVAWTSSGPDNVTDIELTASGAESWSVRIDGSIQAQLLWSADGRWLAGQAIEDLPDTRVDRAFVVDLVSRKTEIGVLAGPTRLLGMTGDGALIFADPIEDQEGRPLDWRFSRMDPTGGGIHKIAAADAVTDPALTLPLDVNARAGGFVVRESIQADPDGEPVGQRIVLREFGGNRPAIELARVATEYDTAFLLPDGSAVVSSVRGAEGPEGAFASSVALVGLNGRAAELWAGGFTPIDYTLAADGDLLGLTGWTSRSRIVVVDLVTAAAVEMPLAPGISEARLVRLVGGERMAAVDPIAATPSPALVPPTPPASPLAGGAHAYAFAVETAADGSRTGHVAVLAPAAGGSVTVTDRLPPIELGGNADLRIDLVVAPGGDQTLVLVESNGGVQSASIWRPPAPPQGVDIPTGMLPRPVWRPDGRALATVADGVLRWFELGDDEVREVRIPEFRPDVGVWFVEPAAWTLDGGSVVLGPSYCTDGCSFSYPSYLLLELTTGNATPYGSNTSVDALATGRLGDYASVRSGDFAYFADQQVLLSNVHGDLSANRPLTWPIAAGELQPEVGFPVWSDDGSRLWIQARGAGGQRVFRLDDPISAAPAPRDVGALPDDWQLDDVAPSELWAVARRVGDVWGFVDLARGTVHEVPGDWSFAGFARQP